MGQLSSVLNSVLFQSTKNIDQVSAAEVKLNQEKSKLPVQNYGWVELAIFQDHTSFRRHAGLAFLPMNSTNSIKGINNTQEPSNDQVVLYDTHLNSSGFRFMPLSKYETQCKSLTIGPLDLSAPLVALLNNLKHGEYDVKLNNCRHFVFQTTDAMQQHNFISEQEASKMKQTTERFMYTDWLLASLMVLVLALVSGFLLWQIWLRMKAKHSH